MHRDGSTVAIFMTLARWGYDLGQVSGDQVQQQPSALGLESLVNNPLGLLGSNPNSFALQVDDPLPAKR